MDVMQVTFLGRLMMGHGLRLWTSTSVHKWLVPGWLR